MTRQPVTAYPRRDWRYAVVGGLCGLVGSACLLLAACSTHPPRFTVQPEPPTPQDVPSPQEESVIPAIVETPAAPSIETPAQLSVSPWDRLRRRFVFADCNYRHEVQRLARVYTKDKVRFAASLAQSLPFLLLVLNELEQRDVPGEFALLPYLESGYSPIPSQGDQPAGIWQIMPDTGREFGLTLNRNYDGRLDIYDSTVAALTLLKQYQQEFHDWRLVDLAFNAGEYRLKKLLGARTGPLSAGDLSRLSLNPITHQHLNKLLALACIVSDPTPFHIDLPEPQADDSLRRIQLGAALDLSLAARLTGLKEARLKQLNPGYLHGRMPTTGPFHLLLPANKVSEFEQTLAAIPAVLWRNWHSVKLKQKERIDVLANFHGIAEKILAELNHVSTDAELNAGTSIFLPGAADHLDQARPTETTIHTVQAGDTLWDIAHHYQIELDKLLHWNGLQRNSTLHVGQRLQLSAP